MVNRLNINHNTLSYYVNKSNVPLSVAEVIALPTLLVAVYKLGKDANNKK